MLAYIGSDERHKLCDRERAKTMLKKLDSKFASAVCVCADWGLVTHAFIRLFDKTAHDIASTKAEVDAFRKAMGVLFGEGAVFSSRPPPAGEVNSGRWRSTGFPAIGGYFGMTGVQPMFVTEHIQKMLRRKAIFNCGQEQVLM